MKGVLEEKSFQFAIRIINLNRFLIETKKEYILSKQLLRSGTSIGANIAEAQFAQSKADFVSKMHISLKEASETRYWLHLLEASYLIEKAQLESILSDCNELINMLVSTCRTSKE
ncbi:MAG: four helix bundle protein [Prevotella sp.]|nr:four helix bundle protein [Prevotella sp.]